MNTKEKSYEKDLNIKRIITPKTSFRINFIAHKARLDPPLFSNTTYSTNDLDINTPRSSIKSYSSFVLALEKLLQKLDPSIKISSEADILLTIEKLINTLKSPINHCESCLGKSESIEKLRIDFKTHQLDTIKEMEKIFEFKVQMKKYENFIKQKEKDLEIQEASLTNEKEWLESKVKEVENIKKSLEIEKNGMVLERKKILESQKELNYKHKELDGKYIKLNKHLYGTPVAYTDSIEKELKVFQATLNTEKHEIGLKNQYLCILSQDLAKQECFLKQKDDMLAAREQNLEIREQAVQTREKELKEVVVTLEESRKKLEEKDKGLEKTLEEKTKNLSEIEVKLKTQKKDMKSKIQALNTQMLKLDNLSKNINKYPTDESPDILLSETPTSIILNEECKNIISSSMKREKTKSNSSLSYSDMMTEKSIKNDGIKESYIKNTSSFKGSFLEHYEDMKKQVVDIKKVSIKEPFCVNSQEKSFKSKLNLIINKGKNKDERAGFEDSEGLELLLSPVDIVRKSSSSASKSLFNEVYSDKPCESIENLARSLENMENALDEKEQGLGQREKNIEKREKDCSAKEKQLEEMEKSIKSADYYKQKTEELEKSLQNQENFKKKFDDLSISYETLQKNHESLQETLNFYKKKSEDLQKSLHLQNSYQEKYESLLKISQESHHYKEKCLELQHILLTKEAEFEELSYLVDFSNELQDKIHHNTQKEKDLKTLQQNLETQKLELEKTAETLKKLYVDLEVQKQSFLLEKELFQGEKETNEEFYRQESINLENELKKKFETSEDSISSDCQSIIFNFTPKNKNII